MKTLAKKGFTINTIYDALGVSVALDLNHGMTTAQEFINDYSEYIPDYALSPLVITPKAFVTDPSGKTPHLPTDNVILASQTTNIKWYVVKDTGNELITSTVGGDYTISTTGATKGQLTVRKNLNVNSGRTFLFTCDFKDERTGMFQTISKTISLTCTAATLTMLKSRLFTPRGNTFNHKTASLSVHQKVYNGGEEMPDVARWWYKDGVQITPANANGITGYYSDTLVVPDSVVGDSETEIKVVADRVEDANFLYGVKDGISYQVSGGQPINTLIPNILTVDRIKSATNFNMSFKLNASNVVAQNQDDAQWYLGPELITNVADREFTSNTGYWVIYGESTIANGVANIKSTAGEKSYISKSIITVGKSYELSYDITENRGGRIKLLYGPDVELDTTVGVNKKVKFVSKSVYFAFEAIGITDIDLDNVSIKERLYRSPNLITGGDFEAGLVMSMINSAGGASASWSLNTLNPIYGSKDGRLTVTSAGTSSLNPALIVKEGGLSLLKKYRLSFSYKVNSGICRIDRIYLGGGQQIAGSSSTISGSGLYSIEFNPISVLYIYFDGRNLFDLQIDNIEIREAVEPRVYFNIPLKDKLGNAVDLQVERKFAYESNTASIVNENVNALISLPQSGAPYTLNGNGVGGVHGIASGSLNVSELQLTQTNAPVPYKPAVLDGYLPATQSDRALTDKVLLKYKLEGIDYTIECPSAVKPDVKMLNPKVVLTNNQGVITNPEKRFSFLWKENGTEIGRGSNIMLPISSAQHNISVEPVLGMDYVKYMCVPDGVDDSLRLDITPSAFDISSDSEYNDVIIDFIYKNDVSSWLFAFGNGDTSVKYNAGTKGLMFVNSANKAKTFLLPDLINGKRYILKSRVYRTITNSVDDVFYELNGVKNKTYSYTEGSSTVINRITMLGESSYSKCLMLSVKVFGKSGSLIHHWDFQGSTPADRLKDKVGTLHLTANNISDLNTFFQPL